MQCGVLDLGAVEGIDIAQLTAGVAQVVKGKQSLHHLLHGERREQVAVDLVQSVAVVPQVALRPFLCIPYGAHALEIHARHEVGGVLVLDEVGERQIACVRMGYVPSHHEGEGSDPRRPEYVGVGCGLGSSLQGALVDRTELVHVIALVRTRTGVHE